MSYVAGKGKGKIGKGKCKFIDIAFRIRVAKEHEERAKVAEANCEKLLQECDEEETQCEIWKTKLVMVKQQLAQEKMDARAFDIEMKKFKDLKDQIEREKHVCHEQQLEAHKELTQQQVRAGHLQEVCDVTVWNVNKKKNQQINIYIYI